jgi:1-acyl-sn-glycerol-3-phosphate acyltransferase
MRFLYLCVKLTFQIPFRVFFKRIARLNITKAQHSRTIYIANHASSFMDPVMLGTLTNPVIYYMVRADVFKPFLLKIFHSLHMMPIYREQDGGDTKAKNDEVFLKCNDLLKKGRNILVFAEGFTDDVFVRRLKPLKKGAARIAFGALDSMDWSEKMYIQTVGINYTDPGRMRSEILFEAGEIICLNDYHEEYIANAPRVITLITKLIDKNLKAVITHVEDESLTATHEHVMEISRNGMNYLNHDHTISLKNRKKYSQDLATYFNSNAKESTFIEFTERVKLYFSLLKDRGVTEEVIFNKATNSTSIVADILMLVLISPFVLLGFLHSFVPYRIAKGFVEKTFGRKVFWSSAKLGIGNILFGIWNLPLVITAGCYFDINGFIVFGYILLMIPFSFVLWHSVTSRLDRISAKLKAKDDALSDLVKQREGLLQEINEFNF